MWHAIMMFYAIIFHRSAEREKKRLEAAGLTFQAENVRAMLKESDLQEGVNSIFREKSGGLERTKFLLHKLAKLKLP